MVAFDVATFTGDLRIFMVFSVLVKIWIFLLVPDDKFDFTKYFQPIIDEFAIGRETWRLKRKTKRIWKSRVCLLKDNTDVYDISFQTDKSIKIKIEVDTQPPLKFRTEQKLLLQPSFFMTRCFVLP